MRKGCFLGRLISVIGGGKMKGIIVVLAFLLLAGCVSVTQQISSSNLPPSQYEVLGKARARARSFMLLYFIPLGFNGMPRRLHERAVHKFGGDDLINPVIYESWRWAFIGTIYSMRLDGTVIRKKK